MTAPLRAGVPVTDVRETIMDIMRTHLDREIDPSVDVFDQGVTSLTFIRVVAQINEKYDIAMDVAELEEASVDALSGLVAEQLRSENR
ncbi:acyl carrier protein [Streptosporangium sp. DT93]|uniref:acyl carrier protein n=1 Tax=Streptosporangium sp. DT93 TaxID=3393428 RepID=UPI003CF2DC15